MSDSVAPDIMNSTAEASAPQHTIEVRQLRVGAHLRFPIEDEDGVLLLAAGQTITDRFLDLLRQRGIDRVCVHESELSRILAGQPQGEASDAPADRAPQPCSEENSGTRRVDEWAEDPASMELDDDEMDWFDGEDHGDAPYSEEMVDEYVDNREERVAELAALGQDLATGGTFDIEALREGVEPMFEEIRRDLDLFARLGVNPAADGYPARHSVHSCMLALAIGATMKLGRQSLRELGMGCLVHDLGMAGVRRAVHEQPKVLNDVEFLAIVRHPVHVFELLSGNEEYEDFPRGAAFVAYQTHERMNGSGYPRGTKANRLHPLSRIAAVADAYIGLVSPRPHRPAMMPYYAIRKMLLGVQQGLFDSAVVRALLATVSVFPLGSVVRLGDGRLARSLRANAEAYDRPTVEIIDTGEIVNLATETDLTVANVVAPQQA